MRGETELRADVFRLGPPGRWSPSFGTDEAGGFRCDSWERERGLDSRAEGGLSRSEPWVLVGLRLRGAAGVAGRPRDDAALLAAVERLAGVNLTGMMAALCFPGCEIFG